MALILLTYYKCGYAKIINLSTAVLQMSSECNTWLKQLPLSKITA